MTLKIEPNLDQATAAATAVERICVRCVMDTTDVEITFDEDGVCNHCRQYERLIKERVWSDEKSARELPKLVDEIKAAGRGRDYDCLIGVSGGVDSTYVAYVAKKQLGLRPLAVHMDNGWNSELAVKNIEVTMKELGIDLFTWVLDWDEFKDLQLAFLKSSTADLEIPTDHAIYAVMAKTAQKHRIKYVLSGSNIRTEAVLPRTWSNGIQDWKYIKSVHKLFGTKPLRTYPHVVLPFKLDMKLRRQTWINILNCLPYRKMEALNVLESEIGYRRYEGKHHESIYTRFFQSYILPTKFKADKRRAHLSALINAGEISREEALAELQKPPCSPETLTADYHFCLKKFGLTSEEFDRLIHAPAKSINDYPAYEHSAWLRFMRKHYKQFKGRGLS